jgi:hypothetical protein
MISNISAESMCITGESDWIQMLSLAHITHDGSSQSSGVARDKREERDSRDV